MKILAIRGCNLASIDGNFEVDFRQEPLRSAGIFAITGNTGAGKTTILDAMCIALYRKSPRLDNIEGNDSLDYKVNIDDVRTLLRKGRGFGFAEVDFLAVDGNEYRSRWSVSRAQQNPTGNLQNANLDMTNLTTGEEFRKLKVKEHETMIRNLVGLEYNQFTRSVLLAQGKFSAFLKAKATEKASMLTTLTDTGIYSLISAKIFAKKKEAAQEIEFLETQRNELQIMKDEELAAVKEQVAQLNAGIGQKGKENEVLRIKSEWLAHLATINSHIAAAEKQLTETKERLLAAKPEIEKLKLIDSIQQIRDEYAALCQTRQQLKTDIEQLAVIEKQLDGKNEDYEKAVKAASDADALQTRINHEFQAAQPLITEASQLEKELEKDLKQHKELTGEIERAAAMQGKYNDEISACEKKLSALVAEQKEKNEWIERHAHFSQAIPMIPAIIANIKSGRNERMNVQIKEKSVAQFSALLAEHEKSLLAARENEEKLKQTMSSEIAALRKRLVDGTPCPVCGSKHHEVIEVAANILEEDLLEKAKEDNRRLIEHLESNISSSRTEIEKLRSAIELHSSAIAEYRSASLAYLQGVENAGKLLEENGSIDFFNTLSANWNKYNDRLSTIANEIAVCTTSKEAHQTHVQELKTELIAKRERLQQNEIEIKEGKERLAAILGEKKSADEMLQHFNLLVADANSRFSAATVSKADIEKERNKLKGAIAGKKQQIADATAKESALLGEINDFLAARNDNMDMEMLVALLQIKHSDITAMRDSIDALQKAMTAAETTIGERRQVLANHYKAPVKPGEEENENVISERLAMLDVEVKEHTALLAQLNLKLLKDEENRNKFEKYSKEYEYKFEQKQQWEILDKAFGSSTGDKLMKAAQEYTLDILLDVANTHLAEMSKRYKLARIEGESLGIKVIDFDMMSETRSAHSLSGGETFMVSLALSLALSSLSSNRMKIESLFIDEGFGALDKDTLQTALMMLEKLQSHGRKIGVISHLNEMLEQIPVKVHVARLSPGRSKIEIKDSRKHNNE